MSQRPGPSPRIGRREWLTGVAALGASACFARRPPPLRGVSLGRHAGNVTAIAYVDEGHAFTADGGEGRITLWDVRARKVARTFLAPGPVRYLDVLVGEPARLVVICEVPGPERSLTTLSVLDAGSGRELQRTFERTTGMISISGLAAMPRARALVSYADRGLPCESALFDLGTARIVRRPPFAADAVTEDRKLALHGAAIWNIDEERVTLSHSTGRATWGVVLAPDGARAVSYGSTGYLWDASGVRRRFAEQRWLWSGAFSPDGDLLLTGSEQRLVLRDGHSGEALASLVGHQGRVMSVATSLDGREALAGDRAGLVAIWRIRG